MMDWEIVGEAENGKVAIELTKTLKPDLVILDVSMPGMSGLDVVRAIRDSGNHAKILLLTLHDAHELIRNAFRLGINGFLLKTDPEEELVHALRVVVGGGVYLSPKLDPDFAKRIITNIASDFC